MSEWKHIDIDTPGVYRFGVRFKARVPEPIPPLSVFSDECCRPESNGSDGRELAVSAGWLAKSSCPLSQFYYVHQFDVGLRKEERLSGHEPNIVQIIIQPPPPHSLPLIRTAV